MLKLKDKIDLKALETIGFKKLNIEEEGEIIAENVYCLIDPYDIKFIENNVVDSCFVQYYFDREGYQTYCTDLENIDIDLITDTNFDLITARLVEKVMNFFIKVR